MFTFNCQGWYGGSWLDTVVEYSTRRKNVSKLIHLILSNFKAGQLYNGTDDFQNIQTKDSVQVYMCLLYTSMYA